MSKSEATACIWLLPQREQGNWKRWIKQPLISRYHYNVLLRPHFQMVQAKPILLQHRAARPGIWLYSILPSHLLLQRLQQRERALWCGGLVTVEIFNFNLIFAFLLLKMKQQKVSIKEFNNIQDIVTYWLLKSEIEYALCGYGFDALTQLRGKKSTKWSFALLKAFTWERFICFGVVWRQALFFYYWYTEC